MQNRRSTTNSAGVMHVGGTGGIELVLNHIALERWQRRIDARCIPAHQRSKQAAAPAAIDRAMRHREQPVRAARPRNASGKSNSSAAGQMRRAPEATCRVHALYPAKSSFAASIVRLLTHTSIFTILRIIQAAIAIMTATTASTIQPYHSVNIRLMRSGCC